MGNMNLSDDKNSEMICLKAVLRIRIRKILGSRIRITNQKLQQKTFYSETPNLKFLIKRL